MISPSRLNPNRLRIGDEVTLLRQGRFVGEDVVVLGFREKRTGFVDGSGYSVSHRPEVYVESENGDCEWVPRSWIKREG